MFLGSITQFVSAKSVNLVCEQLQLSRNTPCKCNCRMLLGKCCCKILKLKCIGFLRSLRETLTFNISNCFDPAMKRRQSSGNDDVATSSDNCSTNCFTVLREN